MANVGPAAWYINNGPAYVPMDEGQSSSSGGIATVSSGPTITTPAGLLLVVVVSEAGSTTLGTLADDAGNSYQSVSQVWDSSAGITAIYYAYNCLALSAQRVIYTKHSSANAGCISVFIVKGALATSGVLDTAVSASATFASSTTPSITSGAPAAKGELILGVVGYKDAATRTLANPTGFSAPPANSAVSTTAQQGGGILAYGDSVALAYAPTLSGGTPSGCIMVVGFKAATTVSGWLAVPAWAASTSYVAGSLIKQSKPVAVGNERVFVQVTSAGHTSGGSEPAWTITKGGSTADNTCTWRECTGQPGVNGDTTNSPTWTQNKNTAVTVGLIIYDSVSGALQMVTTAGTTGNGAQPTFSATAGTTTSDNTVTWTSLGAASNFAGGGAPHARVQNALAANWCAAGNTLFIDSAHIASTPVSNLTWAFPGTTASPNELICYSAVGGHYPPQDSDMVPASGSSTPGTGAIEAASAGGNWVLTGVYYMRGVQCIPATGNSTTAIFEWNSNLTIKHELCTVDYSLISTSSGTLRLTLNQIAQVDLENVSLSFNSVCANGFFGKINNTALLRWFGQGSGVLGAAPPELFNINTISGSILLLNDVDLSIFGSGKTLFLFSVYTTIYARLANCKLGASVVVASGITAPGSVVDLINCDSGATNYMNARYSFMGVETTDTIDIRSGGASDGVTPVSHKIVSNANANWPFPFEALEIPAYVADNIGSAHTINIPMMSNATLTNGDVWPEVEFNGDPASSKGSLVSGGLGSPMGSPSNWATDGSSSWTTTGVSGPVQQTLSVTFTPQQAGPIVIKVMLAKPNQTLRIDPLLQGL